MFGFMSAIERAVEKAGGQTKLGDAIGVTQSQVSQWVNGAPIHPRHFPKIEQATEGEVTPGDLLADELEKYQPKPRRRTS